MSDTVKYCYLRGNGRHVCIARKVDLENNKVTFGFSVCHPNDVFTKKLGRKIAEGRMNSEKRIETVLGESRPLEAVMQSLALNNTVYSTYFGSEIPQCVTTLARDWVNNTTNEMPQVRN